MVKNKHTTKRYRKLVQAVEKEEDLKLKLKLKEMEKTDSNINNLNNLNNLNENINNIINETMNNDMNNNINNDINNNMNNDINNNMDNTINNDINNDINKDMNNDTNNNMKNKEKKDTIFTQNSKNSMNNEFVNDNNNTSTGNNNNNNNNDSKNFTSINNTNIMKKKEKIVKIKFTKEDQYLVVKYKELISKLSAKDVEIEKDFLLKKHVLMQTEHSTKDRISIPIQMDKRILEELKIFYPDNISEQNISVISDFINEATKKLFITILKEFLKEFNNEEPKKNV